MALLFVIYCSLSPFSWRGWLHSLLASQARACAQVTSVLLKELGAATAFLVQKIASPFSCFAWALVCSSESDIYCTWASLVHTGSGQVGSPRTPTALGIHCTKSPSYHDDGGNRCTSSHTQFCALSVTCLLKSLYGCVSYLHGNR